MDEINDPLRHAATVFAKSLAADDESFARIFIDAYTAAARTDLGNRQVAGLRDHGIDEPPSVMDDPIYLHNAKYLIDDVAERILNGIPTTDFPDCVAVGRLNEFCCTGTLIHPSVVLTAGHCAVEGCAGRILIGDRVDDARAQVVLVSQVETHPDYGSGPFNDLALLILAQPVQGVAPRALASPGAAEEAGSVRLVGFGTTDSAGRLGYGERRRVDVAVAAPDTAYGADPLTEFVAGAPLLNKDTCPGDSGGPAYVEIDGSWYLAGVTSRATLGAMRTCGDGGIYERVGAFHPWIEAIIRTTVR